MASKNDTTDEIVDEFMRYVRKTPHLENVSITVAYATKLCQRIKAAHRREVDSLNFKLMTAKSEQKTAANVIIEQTNKVEKFERIIAELRECLKEAIREKCPFTRMSCKHGEQCDYECGTEKWRNALGGSNNATK